MGARADAMTDAAPEAMSAGATAALLPPADGYDATGKSPDSIAADIAATRVELGVILDALEHRLALRQLLERGMDMVKDTMSGEGGGLGDVLRDHPVPLALIGMGVGWLAIAASGRARPEAAGGSYPTAPATFAHAREKTGEAMDQAQQAVSDTVEEAQAAGRSAWRQASHFAEEAAERFVGPRRRAGTLMVEHPLAFGALGLLAGVAVAMLLPRSAVEERLTGPAGAELRQRAASLGRGAMARAQHVAERTLDVAKAAAGAAADAVKNGEAG
jgi:Protein of unknown function (DUF3618)